MADWTGALTGALGIATTGGLSAITGGLFGVFSTGIKAFTDYKNRKLDLEASKQKYEHDERMQDKATELAKYQSDNEKDVEGIKAERDAVVSADELRGIAVRAAEMRLGPQVAPLKGRTGAVLGFFYGLADFCTKMIRPVITLFAAYYFHLLWEWAQALGTRVTLEPAQAFSLQMEVLTSTIFLSVNIISFWFGMRAISAPSEKMFGAWLAKK